MECFVAGCIVGSAMTWLFILGLAILKVGD